MVIKPVRIAVADDVDEVLIACAVISCNSREAPDADSRLHLGRITVRCEIVGPRSDLGLSTRLHEKVEADEVAFVKKSCLRIFRVKLEVSCRKADVENLVAAWLTHLFE